MKRKYYNWEGKCEYPSLIHVTRDESARFLLKTDGHAYVEISEKASETSEPFVRQDMLYEIWVSKGKVLPIGYYADKPDELWLNIIATRETMDIFKVGEYADAYDSEPDREGYYRYTSLNSLREWLKKKESDDWTVGSIFDPCMTIWPWENFPTSIRMRLNTIRELDLSEIGGSGKVSEKVLKSVEDFIRKMVDYSDNTDELCFPDASAIAPTADGTVIIEMKTPDGTVIIEIWEGAMALDTDYKDKEEVSYDCLELREDIPSVVIDELIYDKDKRRHSSQSAD